MRRTIEYGNGRVRFWEDNTLVGDVNGEFAKIAQRGWYPMPLDLTKYAKEVHEANKKWWVCLKCTENGDYVSQCSLETEHCPPHAHNSYIKCPFCNGTKVAKRNVGEMIALMHSELSEALEGDRKGLKDDKLPQWEMIDVEMVDCIIRIFDFLGQKGVDVERIFRDKMEFNRVREDHKLESRMREGGKKY